MSDTKIITINAHPFANAMNAHYCTDTERVSATLAGIALVRHDDQWCIVATDGKALVEFDLTADCMQVQGDWPASIIIPAADAKFLAKMKPKNLSLVTLTIERHSDKMTVSWVDKKGPQDYEVKPNGGTYPNYRTALRDEDETPKKTDARVALNMGYLERIHKAMGGTIKNPVRVIITNHSANRGLMIKPMGASNVRALLLPISLPPQTGTESNND